MRYGIRKPSIKKSFKARTTGRIKRQVKKAINPLYGAKGMGVINDPKKAAYNAIYNRTSVGINNAKRATRNNVYSRPPAGIDDFKTQRTASSSRSSGNFLRGFILSLKILCVIALLAIAFYIYNYEFFVALSSNF